MKNFVKKGAVIDYANASGSTILSGAVVVMAGLIGVAVTDILDTYTGSINLEGVYELPLKSALSIPAIGTRLYWNDTANECDTDITVGTFIGNCAASTADSAHYVRVLLAGEGNGIAPQATIAAIATADGSDAGTTQTLANATKSKVNAILAALKLAGIIASS